jgi:HEAT repeat protein
MENQDLAPNLEEASRLLEDADPRKRFQGVSALAAMGRQLPLAERARVVELIGSLVNDKGSFVRWNVATALGQVGHESGVKYLGELLGDEHANVRFRVAQALGQIGSEIGVPVLEKLAYDSYDIGGHYVVRAYAAAALGMIPCEGSVRSLAALVQDKDPVVRWHAAVALGNLGFPSGVEHLAKLVEDDVPFVRAHTGIALAQIGDESGLPYLERLASDSVPRVAGISGAALELCKAICERYGESA